ncbi:MAG: hypothetical protein ACRD2D_05330 [Terriglobales bacterium]
METVTDDLVRSTAGGRLMGRHVLGVSAIFCAGVDLFWRPVAGWQSLAPLRHLPHATVLALLLLVAVLQGAGGIAILAPAGRRRVLRLGAGALAVAYLVITLLTLPALVGSPLVFNSWGNLGEQLSRLAGAVLALVMARATAARARSTAGQVAYWAFGLCVVSFMVEQWVYFPPTVALVPKWLPPGQYFWAIATTVAFGLAAAALLVRRAARLAAELLTAMLVIFGVAVWIPILVKQPHVATNWSECAVTFSIAGAAWVVSDALRQQLL